MKRNLAALSVVVLMIGSVLVLGAKGKGGQVPGRLSPSNGSTSHAQNVSDEVGNLTLSMRPGPPEKIPVPLEPGPNSIERVLLVLVEEGSSGQLGEYCEVLERSSFVDNLYYVRANATDIGRLRTLPFVVMMTDGKGLGIFASYLKDGFREKRDEILETMGYGDLVDDVNREQVEEQARRSGKEDVGSFSDYITPQDEAILDAVNHLDRTAEAVYDWVTTRMLWISDMELFGVEERWLTSGECLVQTPDMPPVTGWIKSDCEEQANTLVSMLRAAGLGPEVVRVVLGLVSFQGIEGGHAWVEVLTDDGWLALDPTSGGYIKDGAVNEREALDFGFFAASSYPESERWYEYNDVYYRDYLGGEEMAPVQWEVFPVTVESLLKGELRDVENAADMEGPPTDLPVDLEKLKNMKGLLFGRGSRLAYREGAETVLSWVASDEAAGYAIYAADSIEGFDFSAPNDQVGNSTQVWKDTSATDARYYVVREMGADGEIIQNFQVAGIFDKHLDRGWNIVSFPYEVGFTASSLLEQIGEAATSVARRSGDGSLYEHYVVDPGSGVGFGGDFDIVRDEAYYVWLESEVNVTLSGIVEYNTSVLTELDAGRWNLVGKPSFSAGNISETFSNLSNETEIVQIARRRPDGSFEFYIEGFTSSEFFIQPSEGYYVWVSRNTTWAVERKL